MMKRHPLSMVVDDDHEMQSLLQRLLRLEGYDVIVAPDGKTALTLFKECSPDLMVSMC